MQNETKKRNIWLDLFKLFLCWLVVCIHFAGHHYAHHPLYRLAVPMFFIISGYFLYHKESEIRKKKAVTFAKRSAAYMLFGLAFYVVYGFAICFIDGKDPSKFFIGLYYSDFIRNFLLFNSNPLTDAYHLWFIIALFVVALLHLLIVRFKKEHWYYVIIPLCTAVHLFFNGTVKDFGGTVVHLNYTRNALFFGLPMCALGYVLAKFNLNKFKWLKFIYLALGLLFFYLQIEEGKTLLREVYFSSILSAAFLLLFFVGLKPVSRPIYYSLVGKSMPFYVYIIHLAVGKRLEKHVTINDLYLKCLAIFLISILLYEVCYLAIKGIGILIKKVQKTLPKKERDFE